MNGANQLALELGEKIVRYCVANELQRGERLTERKLGGEFNVSRSPIRAALKLLEERNIIIRSGSGYALALGPEDLGRMRLDVPAPASEELYIQILRDRFAGKLGEHVSEADFLRDYGVTRGVLMKALMRLNQEGYVSRSPGRGWTFISVLNSIDTYRASYEFRLAIEPAALGSPNYRIDRERVQNLLNRHLELFRRGAATVGAAEWFALDAELHEMLVDFSCNEFFMQAMRGQNQLRRAAEIESFYADERVRESFEEHIAILEALLKGDRSWAAILLSRHLNFAANSTEVFLSKA